MAYGSPGRVEDVKDYLSDIYEGKPVPEYAMEENLRKYRMVNGKSPSNGIIEILKAKLQDRLSEMDMTVFLGNKHWHPKLDDTLVEMQNESISNIIAIPLFPFPSNNVRSSYLDPALRSMTGMNYSPDVEFVNGFYEYDLFRSTWADIISKEIGHSEVGIHVFYSAHSLPLFRNSEDAYDRSYREGAEKISKLAGLKSYSLGYQSRGKYGDKWLGPLLPEVLDNSDKSDIEEVLAVPLGFCYEHLEILYDLDIEFGKYVRDQGLKYRRTALPDYSDAWVEMFVRIVEERSGGE